MKRHLIIPLAALIAAAPGAFAQQGDAEDQSRMLVEVEEHGDRIVPRFNVSIDTLRDMYIYGAGGVEIGVIDDVLASPDGEIAAVTVEVGGFLGIGEREAIIDVDKIILDGLRLTLDMSKEEIETLPQWQD